MSKFIPFDRISTTGALPSKIFVNPLTVSLLWPNGVDKTTLVIVGSGESIIVVGSSAETQRRLEEAMK